MKLEQAIAIIEDAPYDPGKKNVIANGFAILAKYGELDVCAEHDVIYVSVQGPLLDDLIARMSEEDVRELAALRWRIMADVDSWGHYV